MTATWLKRVVVVVALILTGAAPAAAHSYRLGALRIEHPRSRPTPPSAPTAVGYVTIVNTGKTADTLLGGTSPLVGRVEVHDVSMTGGVMRMRPMTAGMAIGPGETLALGPGGSHLMLVGPKRPFKAGDRIPMTLRFAKAGNVQVEFITLGDSTAEHHH